jgi:hypothetical protein
MGGKNTQNQNINSCKDLLTGIWQKWWFKEDNGLEKWSSSNFNVSTRLVLGNIALPVLPRCT